MVLVTFFFVCFNWFKLKCTHSQMRKAVTNVKFLRTVFKFQFKLRFVGMQSNSETTYKILIFWQPLLKADLKSLITRDRIISEYRNQ